MIASPWPFDLVQPDLTADENVLFPIQFHTHFDQQGCVVKFVNHCCDCLTVLKSNRFNVVRYSTWLSIGIALLLMSPPAQAQTINVSNTTELKNAIQTLNADPTHDYIINFTGGFTLNQALPAIASNATVTLAGNTFTLNGANTYQPYTIDSGIVSLSSLNVTNVPNPIHINGGTLIGSTDLLPNSITDNGGLIFLQSTAGTYNGIITGTGTVEFSGGPITLTGANTYSGGTLVDPATTLIGTTTSIQGSILNRGTVQFDQATNGTYSGVMSGSGKAQISGGGQVTFSGANTYAGGTTVDNPSTLIGTTTSLQGDFTNNGVVRFNQAGSGTFSGDMSGNGTLQISGGGTVTLSGTNSYTGGTTVNVGNTLIGTTSSLQGSVLNDGSVKFDQATAGTYGGAMSGTGSLTIAGAGPITLTGLNTYSGGTTINSGSSLIGNTDSIHGNILNDGSLQIGKGTSTTYAGIISGSGTVNVSGGQSVIFSGLNTYSGGTTIDSVTTLIGTTQSLQGNFTNDGTLEFNQATAGTYAGVVSGQGGMRISGGAAITLTGLNTYTGGTTIDASSSLVGTTSSVHGSITNDGDLTFDQTAAGTYSSNMVGSGHVTISGTGPITFSGTNSYSGGTTVDSGSSLTGSTSNIQGDVVNDGSVKFSQSTQGSYAGDMSGSGNVTITGGGQVTFSGLNSYSGGTTINTGSTLAGTTNSLQGSITNDGTLSFNQGFAGTYAGNISGSGSVKDLGTGTLRLTGTNTYSGGTTVNGGGVMIGTTNSLQGDFTNNGTVVFDQAAVGTYSGDMSGAGRVEVTGGGAITFSGVNSYVGGTSVLSGSELIGTTSSLTGAIDNAGLVNFNQSTAGTYAGAISGAGAVGISGTGPVTFSGLNAYTGGTTIDTGSTLIGTTSSLQGNFDNSGLLRFNQSTTGTYGGVISGSGGVRVSGGGTVTLTGQNTYTGGTTIDSLTTLVGTTSTIQGNVVDNGILNFNQSTAGNFAGNISGGGGVSITGTGPITFTGTNTYTGGTTIATGSTLIGNTSNLHGIVSSMGSLVFNQSTTGTFLGGVTGSGNLLITGGGTITFAGTNNHTGGTTIDTGSKVIGNANAIQGAITNNGSIQFNHPSAGTFFGSISGTGDVQVSGVGPLTFIGTNTYSGGTTVDQGSSLIGTTDNIQGDFLNNGAIQFNQTANGTYSGDMSGTGSVKVSGSNRVIFTGQNSYSGGTTIDSGATLTGGLQSLQGAFTNNGSLQIATQTATSSAYETFAGAISGTGQLQISGGGNLKLTGVNSYTGGTTLDANTTILGSTASIQGDIANSGRVIFADSLNPTPNLVAGIYSGVMSGTGSVEIQASSTPVIFTGANTYTGGTSINSGAMLVGTSTSLQGSIVNNGYLGFAQLANGTFAGNISGTGGVEVGGTGALTLSGTNTYTGGTLIDSGATLIGTTNSLNGLIANQGSLVFNQSAAGTYSRVISGTGQVEIGGTGPITFTGTNTYTGGTKIDNGSTLIVGAGGSIVGTTTVNSGGTLKGQGSVGAVTVNAGGTINPGAAGSPLTINGNFQQATGSTYAVQLTPDASDKIVVNGTGTIANGTTLKILPGSGTFTVGKHYDIIETTGGLTGAYTTQVMSSINQKVLFMQHYDANGLELYVNSNLSPYASTTNQLAVARIFDQTGSNATGDYANGITQLTSLSSSQLTHALNQLSGDIYPSLGTIERQTTSTQMLLLSNRLANLTGAGIPSVEVAQRRGALRLVSSQGDDAITSDVAPGRRSAGKYNWTSWAQGYGLGGSVGSDGNAGGLNYQLGGTLFGIERWFDPHTMVGVLGGYAATSVRNLESDANSQINAFQVGLYELRRADSLYLSNIDAYSNSDYDVTRPLNFGNIQQTATGTSSGNQYAHYTEAGATFDFDDVRLQPFLGLQYMYLNQKGFNESGGGTFNLSNDGQTISSLRNTFGARISRETMIRNTLVIPTLAARYQHEWGDGTQLISSSFSGVPTVQFATSGAQTGRNFGLITLGATAYFTERFSVYGLVDTQFASKYSAVMGSGGLQYSW